MKGDMEVRYHENKENFTKSFQEELEIREEFAKLDTDNSGFITRGKELKHQLYCHMETVSVVLDEF